MMAENEAVPEILDGDVVTFTRDPELTLCEDGVWLCAGGKLFAFNEDAHLCNSWDLVYMLDSAIVTAVFRPTVHVNYQSLISLASSRTVSSDDDYTVVYSRGCTKLETEFPFLYDPKLKHPEVSSWDLQDFIEDPTTNICECVDCDAIVCDECVFKHFSSDDLDKAKAAAEEYYAHLKRKARLLRRGF